MEPILIANLRKDVQTALLNAQYVEQFNLNPSKNAYIEENEVEALLKFFGAQKIEDLMETGLDTFHSNISNNTPTGTDETTVSDGTDVSVVSQNGEELDTDTSKDLTVETETPAEVEDSENPQKTTTLSMIDRDSARLGLISSDAGDVELKSPTNPLNTIYEAANNNYGLQMFIEEVSGEIQKVEDAAKEASMVEEGSISYTDKNGNEKTVYVRQSVSMGGMVSKKDSDDDDDNTSGNNEAELNDDDDETKNTLNGGIHYTLIANTDNTKFGFKAHIDNTDQDFFSYIAHDKTLNNSDKIELTGAARVTLDQGLFNASGGLSLDYRKDNLSTGIYGHVNYENSSSEKTLDYNAEAYLNYKKIGGLYAGVQGNPKEMITPFLGAKLYGSKKFDNGLSIEGALSAEACYWHFTKMPDYDIPGTDVMSAKVTARGNLSFKAGDDLNANLDAILIYDNMFTLNSNDKPVQDFGALLRGTFRKGRTEVYATGCIHRDIGSEDSLVTGAATFGIQINDLFKKGIAAYVEGTVCNDTDANTNPNSSLNGIKVGSRINF